MTRRETSGTAVVLGLLLARFLGFGAIGGLLGWVLSGSPVLALMILDRVTARWRWAVRAAGCGGRLISEARCGCVGGLPLDRRPLFRQ